PVVGHVVGPGGRVDAGDPQLPEVALALATVAVAVGHRVEHLLLGLAVQARALPAVALGGLKYDPTLLLCVDGSLHACHWSILTCRGGHLSVTGSSGMERAQSPRSRLTRGTSASATSVRPSSRRVRLLGFFSMMWRRLACWRTSLPVPVFRKRLAVPLWVFIFGMIASSSHGSSRMTRWGLGWADAVRPVVCRCPPGGLSGVLVRDLGALLLREGLGATVGRHDHGHVAAVLLGAGLDVPGLGDVVRQSLEEPEPELGPRLLTATEHDRHLDLGALLQETDDVPLLGLV